MTSTASPAHWRLDIDADGVAWLAFDRQGGSANTLGRAVMEQLDARLAEIESARPRAVVVVSAKESGFIAGADITEFTGLSAEQQAYELVRAGQGVLDRLEALPCPTVAAIHGFALGGGLELALACRYRVAADDDRLTLGLPEVMLGIRPGFGGTVRTPRLIGAPAALDGRRRPRALRRRPRHRGGLATPSRRSWRVGVALTSPRRTREDHRPVGSRSSLGRGLAPELARVSP